MEDQRNMFQVAKREKDLIRSAMSAKDCPGAISDENALMAPFVIQGPISELTAKPRPKKTTGGNLPHRGRNLCIDSEPEPLDPSLVESTGQFSEPTRNIQRISIALPQLARTKEMEEQIDRECSCGHLSPQLLRELPERVVGSFTLESLSDIPLKMVDLSEGVGAPGIVHEMREVRRWVGRVPEKWLTGVCVDLKRRFGRFGQ
jgi:hypothetical protein